MSPRTRAARTPRATFLVGSARGESVRSHSFDDAVFEKAPAKEALDVNDIRGRLERLHRYAHVPITDLPDSLMQDHNVLAAFAEVTHQVPQEYEKFYNVVSEVFAGSVAARAIAPGTVGSYYAGCMDVTDDNEVCSVHCAGSIPKPGFSQCGMSVIRAIVASSPDTPRRADGAPVLNYQVLSENKNAPERAILYVPKGTFTGISPKVGNFFKDHFKIRKIRVVSYEEGENDAELSARAMIASANDSGFVEIETLISHSLASPVSAGPQARDATLSMTRRSASEDAPTRAGDANARTGAETAITARASKDSAEVRENEQTSRECKNPAHAETGACVLEEKSQKSGYSSNLTRGLPTWAIILIIVMALVAISLVIALVALLMRGRTAQAPSYGEVPFIWSNRGAWPY